MSIDEMVGLLLPIGQYFSEQAEHAENPVDAEIANHYGIPFIDPMNDEFLTSDLYNDNIVGGHPTAPLYSGIALSVKGLIEKNMESEINYYNDYYPA